MAPSDLADHIGYRIRQLSNHVSQAFARKLAERDVTVAEWCVLRAMYGRDALAPSMLAAEMNMTRGAISKLAERLVAKGLVVRAADDRDGRAQTLRLAGAAIGFVPELAALADANDAECFGHLTDDERHVLMDILVRTIDRLGVSTMPTS